MQKGIEELAKTYAEKPEELTELIAFRSKFYSYSVKNTMMIYMQNPHSSFVGSYLKFKELGNDIATSNNLTDDKGRLQYLGVKKGAKGMNIYVPVSSTFICVDKSKDRWVKLSEATIQQKEKYKQGLLESFKKQSFKLGTVFDISQTNIPPEYYPEIYSMGYASDKHANIYQGLKEYIETELKCPVDENIDNSISLHGLCYTEEKGIELNSKLKDTQMLSTLSHELGHFLMHRNDLASDKPTEQVELEADIFSIMLNFHFNIEPTESRKRHLASSYKSYINQLETTEKPLDSIEKIFTSASNTFNNTIEDIEQYVEQSIELNEVHEFEASNLEEVQEFDFDMGMTLGM